MNYTMSQEQTKFEGSNDDYCINSSDFYINCNVYSVSAGFAHSSVTEEDTSETETQVITQLVLLVHFIHSIHGYNCYMCFYGVDGGSGTDQCEDIGFGGGGGFAKGTLAVTASQTFKVIVGEGGMQNHYSHK